MKTDRNALDIGEIASYLEDRRFHYSMLIFSVVFLFFVASFDINLYFYTSTFIISRLNEPELYIGISVSAFTLGVIIFAAAGGMAFSRMSIRNLILAAVGTATAGSLLTGYVGSVPELLVLRFMVGAGTGIIQGASMGFLGTAYPEKRGYLLSLTGLAFAAGLLMGPFSVSLIAPHYLQSYLISGVIGAAALILIMRYMPNVHARRRSGKRGNISDTFNRNTILIFAGIFAYGIGFFGFIGYFSHYLLNYLHMSQTVSSLTASMLGIGGLFFTLPFGYASDRFGRKRVLLLLYGMLATTSFLIFGIAVSSAEMIAISFVFGAAYNGLIIIIAAAAQDFAARESIGTASGMVFTFYYAGGIIGGTLFGLLLTLASFRITGLASVTTFITIGFVATLFLSRTAIARSLPVSPEEAAQQNN